MIKARVVFVLGAGASIPYGYPSGATLVGGMQGLQDVEFWMYYCGSQRCADVETYKGVAKDPEKSGQRRFKLGLAKSTDGVHFTRVSRDLVFSFGDDIHSVVTAAILKNVDEAPGQARVPIGIEARLGVELHDESHAAASPRRQLPPQVRRSPPAAVE